MSRIFITEKNYDLYLLLRYLRIVEKQLMYDPPEAVERLMHVGWRCWYDLERKAEP